jgi:multidrug efflux system membrane fusion protein
MLLSDTMAYMNTRPHVHARLITGRVLTSKGAVMNTFLISQSFRRASGSLARLTVVTAIALALAACHKGKEMPAPPAAVVALPVHSAAGTAGEMAIRYPVEVTARYSNPMGFRVAGKLIERKVRIGDTVKKGDVVARLDPLDAQKQAASAQASLRAAEHRLLFAKQQLDRDTAQSTQNLIAAKELEQTQDAFTAALSARDEAAAQWVLASNNLQYTTLTADQDGVITSENADTGQVVSAGQEIYGLAWSGDVDITLDAAASDLSRISIGQVANVTFPALAGRGYAARVREITPTADPQSRTYRVKLTLTEPDEAVRLGMTGDAILSPLSSQEGAGSSGKTFAVPATALFHKDNTPAVWVVGASNSTLELRPVAVRSYTDHSVMVTGGLKDGETVVLSGVHTVYAGERVNPVRPLFDNEGEVAGPAPSGSPAEAAHYAANRAAPDRGPGSRQ